jgi:hypothetical protein
LEMGTTTQRRSRYSPCPDPIIISEQFR